MAQGPDDVGTMGNLGDLACMLQDSKDFRGVLECLLRLLEHREWFLPAAHPGIASVMIDVAFSFMSLGELEKAEDMQSRVLEMAERELPKGRYDLTVCLLGQGQALKEAGRLESDLPSLFRTKKNLAWSPRPLAKKTSSSTSPWGRCHCRLQRPRRLS